MDFTLQYTAEGTNARAGVIKTDFGKYPDAIDTTLYDRTTGRTQAGWLYGMLLVGRI